MLAKLFSIVCVEYFSTVLCRRTKVCFKFCYTVYYVRNLEMNCTALILLPTINWWTPLYYYIVFN